MRRKRIERIQRRFLAFPSTAAGGRLELEGAPQRSAASPGGALRGAKEGAIDEVERSFVSALLAEHRHNVSRATRSAGMDRRTLLRLLRLLRKHWIDAGVFHDGGGTGATTLGPPAGPEAALRPRGAVRP